MATVPVIDLGAGDEQQVAQALRHACEHVGFLYVSGHGVPGDLWEDVFRLNRALFALPIEDKRALVADSNNRGWTPFKEVRRSLQWSAAGAVERGHIGRALSLRMRCFFRIAHLCDRGGLCGIPSRPASAWAQETLDPANQTTGDTKEGFCE